MRKNIFVSYLSLFTSVGTLLCCALPSLLVFLGMGASLAGLIGAFPQLVWVSEYKTMVFGVSGALILFSVILTYIQRNDPCPLDPNLAKACATSRRISIWTLILSGVIWFTGFSFAFIAPLFL